MPGLSAAEPDGGSIDLGLSESDVARRVADGQVNRSSTGTERSLPHIIRANVLTPVNGIMLALFALILMAGFWRDGLFVGVVLSNSVIGVWQELKARRELRRLEVLNAPNARVVRSGVVAEVESDTVVVDDVIDVGPGDQVVVDGVVVTAGGLESDESLLTGESEPVRKQPGDPIRSGSYVVSGTGRYRATGVGEESYANSLAAEARRFSLVNSELRRGINTILKVLVVLIPPACVLLLFALLEAEDTWQLAIQGTVAAAVAMVPDGLVLLTSLAFGAGVIALTRRQVLAKELATVELLARVDVLCLDKTGTITTGDISFAEAVPVGGSDRAMVDAALGAVGGSDPRPNPTMNAIMAANPQPQDWEPLAIEPFSSARKWSAVAFADRGCWYIGAPDILFGPDDDEARAVTETHIAGGRRVLLLCQAAAELSAELPADRRAVAVILLEDTIRPDAPEILQFFSGQGVTLKVISGDNVDTVGSVANRAGVPNAEARMDGRDLPEAPEELADVLDTTAVFGRVSPHQKQAMVGALQSRGHVVAMTGDGVNDVLALKDADMGIAMGNGSPATRGVAQLVLLDNKFSTLPEVLAQGRRVINNIERVANLFVTKAVYAVLLTALIGLEQIPFPLLPRQLTLIGTFSIGLPGLFLALAGNEDLVRSGFLRRILSFSVPAGAVSGFAAWLVYRLATADDGTTLSEARTAATVTLLGLGLVVLVVVSRPLQPWKIGLAATMALLYVIVLAVPAGRDFFQFDLPGADLLATAAAVVVVAGCLIASLPRLLPELRAAHSR